MVKGFVGDARFKKIYLLLDIVQSFPLLSYCIVSPIYISPICNV